MSAPATSTLPTALADQFREPYFELDAERRVRNWNAAMATWAGVTREAALGARLGDVVPALAGVGLPDGPDDCAATAEATFEVDGRSTTVTVRPTPLDDGLAVVLSPTASAAPLDVLFANTLHYQALFSPDGTVLAANDALLSMVDLAAEDVVGTNLAALPVTLDVATAYADVVDIFLAAVEGERADGEVVLHGERHEVSVHPIFCDEGAVSYLVFEGRNVSDLRAAEAERDRLFDVSRDLVCTLEFEGHLTQVNPRWRRLLGWLPDDLLGTPLLDLVHPEERDEVAARLTAVTDTEDAVRVDARLRAADGDYRWFTWDCLSVSSGEAVAVIARDVTTEKEYEATLERQRDLFERVQEMADIGGWELDLRTDELYWSEQVYTLHGLSPESFMPTVDTAVEFYHPDDRPVLERLIERALRDGTGWDEVLRIVTADGEVRRVHAKGTVYHDGDEPTHCRGTFQDVTEEYEREARLRESEDRLRLLIDSLPQFVWLKDAEGRYRLANEALATAYGTTVAALEGATDADFALAGDRDFRVDDRETLASGEPRTFVEELTDATGRHRVVQTQLLPFDATTTDERLLLGIATDITERERAATQLRASNDYLQQLYEVSTRPLPLTEKVTALLEVGRDRFGLDLGLLAHVEDDRYTVEACSTSGDPIASGESFDLAETFCERTLRARSAVDFHAAHPDRERSHPAYAAFGVESYIGAPVVVHGEPFGTVNFSSTSPLDRPFDDNDRVYVTLLAQWIGYELERAADERELARREEQLRTIVDTVPYPIFLKDGDGVYHLANEAAAAVIGRPVSMVEGGSDTDFFGPEAAAEINAVDRRAIDGALSTEPFIETVRHPDGEERVYQSRKIRTPAAETDEPLVLGVAVDVTDLKATEAALQASKEELEVRYTQLEFFDSLMRHDVLNALTVVRLTAELLAEDGPDEATRADAALIVDWSDDIAQLIGRIRSVVDALTDDEPLLRAVDVDATLTPELDRLRSAYPAATVTASVEAGATVLAGDLLGEVLGNVVRNAIVHSDRPAPTVDVAVTRADGTVRVVVADDGPGVPDDRKAAIFRRGETSHVKHSGSGFGLFFVDATVSSYGGSVRVEDNAPRGARFVIELPDGAAEDICRDDD
jgi:PAS domain S-box-containing protein